MRKLDKILLFVLCLTMTGVMNPAITFSQPVSPSSGMPAIIEASGEIISVDIPAKTVVVKIIQDEIGATFQKVTLLIDVDTMINSEDSTLVISDLKAGDKVTVVYETTAEGINTATSIMVR